MISKKLYNIVALRVITILVSFLTYYLFQYLYRIEISPSEAYVGFVYEELSIFKEIVSLCFLAIPIIFLPLKLCRPSDITIWITYLIPYQSTIYMSFHITRGTTVSVVLLWISILASLLIMTFVRRHKLTVRFKKHFKRDVNFNILFLLSFVAVCFYLLYVIRFRFNFSVEDVYTRRMSARENAPFLYGYIIAIAKSCLTVGGIYLAVIKKQWRYLLLTFLAAFSIFSFDGTKTSVLLPCFLIGIAFYSRYSQELYRLPLLLFICPFFIIISILEVIFMHSNIASLFFTRRMFAVPGFLNTAFWDFFTTNPKTLMTESIGRFFVEPIYSVSPTFLIGIDYFNNEAINANTGIWLGAFSQFGVLGMLFISCLAGVLLGLVDNMTKNNFFVIGCLVCGFIGLNWTEQMLHTSMLTGGVVYLILGVFLIHKSRNLQQIFFTAKPVRS